MLGEIGARNFPSVAIMCPNGSMEWLAVVMGTVRFSL
jgi:hypothetical protein